MNIRDTIGGILIAAFIAALFILFWRAIPQTNEQLIVYMLGQLSGFVGGVVAAHYTINAGAQKLDEKRAENTGKAFEAITATARTGGAPAGSDGAADAADEVVGAAQDKADEIRADVPDAAALAAKFKNGTP